MSGGFDPITSKLRERKLIVYDLEWEPETLKFRLGGVFDGKEYRSATNIKDFLGILFRSEHRGAWIYAHAGGMADSLFILEELLKYRQVQVEGVFSGSSAIMLKVKKGKNAWTLLDSFWLLRDKLAHLGKFSGLEKTRGDYQCSNYPGCGHIGRACGSAPKCGCPVGPEPLCMFYAPIGILKDYNERDNRILWNCLSRFHDELLSMGTDMQITIASTAMRLFRRIYLKEPIVTSEVMSDIIRPGYIASRVEPYRAECSDTLLEWDVNSSFPYAMTFPTPGTLICSNRALPETGCYFARCTIRVPPMWLPPLGKRGKDNRIYFPIGEWEGMFSAPDLELLQETGGSILKVHEVHHYESRDDFSRYATDLYDKRRKATDPFIKILLKYLLNSCYGKTAESREKERLVIHPDSLLCPHEGIHNVKEAGEIVATCVTELFPGVILITETKSIAHEHVPVAAQITSEARRTLYKYASQCGEDLYYSDTDSIYTHKKFKSTDELGGVKLEREVQPPSLFISPKLYMAGGKVRSKGFSNLSVDQFKSLIGGEPVLVERMYRIREMARTKLTIAPAIAHVEKRLALENLRPKRKMLPGNTSEPWHVDEVERKWS